MTTEEIIESAKKSGQSLSGYLKGLPKESYSHTSDLLVAIKEAQLMKNDRMLESLLIIAFWDGVNKKYTGILSELLFESWHHSHEDIAWLLKEIRDPMSINALYYAATHVPDYDDGRALARKCIWALGAIKTDEAKKKLELLQAIDDPIIKGIASSQIQDISKAN